MLFLTLFYWVVINSAFSNVVPPVPIVFASDINGNWEIYLTDSDGKSPINLTLTLEADYYPTWSPDTTKIAFFSRRDGNHERYVMNDDGTHQKRLTHHLAADKAPSWSPDGKYIVYSSMRQDVDQADFDLYVMNVWHWDRINHWLNAGTFDREWKFDEAGETVLRIAVREDATKLDAIFVTSNEKAVDHGAANVRLPTDEDQKRQVSGLAVDAKGKVTTTWGSLKKAY